MPPTIEVLYSCSCGLKDVPVQVPARTTEELREWMHHLRVALSADHARRSPHCPARATAEVRIPLAGTCKVGGPVEK